MWVDPKAPADNPRHPSQVGQKLEHVLEPDPHDDQGNPQADPQAVDAPPEKAPPKARRKSTRKPANLKDALAKLDKTKGSTT